MCGLIKPGIIIFIIVIFHELGHALAAKINKYEILNISIYPFGGITKLSSDINSPIIKDLFLAINGVVFQIILFFIFKNLNSLSIITDKTFNIFKEYNTLIMLFNLLPIEPLDGAKILEIILSYFLPFKKTLNIKLIISVLFLIIFVICNLSYSINNYMIICFLIYKLIEYKKNTKYLYNKFLMERYVNNYEFKKIKNEKNIDLKCMKKNVFYYFWNKNTWINEKKAIKKSFYP